MFLLAALSSSVAALPVMRLRDISLAATCSGATPAQNRSRGSLAVLSRLEAARKIRLAPRLHSGSRAAAWGAATLGSCRRWAKSTVQCRIIVPRCSADRPSLHRHRPPPEGCLAHDRPFAAGRLLWYFVRISAAAMLLHIST